MGTDPREPRFLISFALAVLVIGVIPVSIVLARFASMGEFEFFDTDSALASERLHGPLDLHEYAYKFRMSGVERAPVLLLGSSNVMQFRSTLFDCPTPRCFYNAGGGMPTTRAGLDFFRGLVERGVAPDVLLLAFDTWHFDPTYDENTHGGIRTTPTFEDQARLALGVTRKFAPRIASDPDLMSLVLGARPIAAGSRGVRAILRAEGFRDDGSYSYGTVATAATQKLTPAERSADVIDRIARDCCRFRRFSAVDARSVEESEALLDAAAKAGTKVIAFHVPLSDAVMDAVDGDPGERAAFDAVERAVRALAARHGVPFVWISRPSEVGCAPSEMLDAFHPSEVCSARILARVAARGDEPKVLGPYLDLPSLQRKLDHPYSELFIERP